MSYKTTDGSSGLVICCASSELFLHILSPPNSHGLSVWPIQNPYITLKNLHGHSVSMETDGFLLNNPIFCVCDTSGQTVLNNMWTMLDWFHIYVWKKQDRFKKELRAGGFGPSNSHSMATVASYGRTTRQENIMVTEPSGIFFQQTVLRPCLDLKLRPH